MIRLFCCLSITLWALFSAVVWAQAPEEAATEGSATEETEAGEPKKPQRPPASASRPKVPKGEYQSMSILVEEMGLDDGSLTWLKSQTEEFLAYWQKDRSGYPKGALLIVHGEGESVIAPDLIKPLHDTLPDYGWATLSINLPPPPIVWQSLSGPCRLKCFISLANKGMSLKPKKRRSLQRLQHRRWQIHPLARKTLKAVLRRKEASD